MAPKQYNIVKKTRNVIIQRVVSQKMVIATNMSVFKINETHIRLYI